MSRNTNCLQDIKCPKCGNESKFTVVVEVKAALTDDGVLVDEFSDCHYDGYSHAECAACNHSGGWATFHTDNQ